MGKKRERDKKGEDNRRKSEKRKAIGKVENNSTGKVTLKGEEHRHIRPDHYVDILCFDISYRKS